MRWRSPVLMVLIIVGFYWKLTLSRQFTFLESLDQADQVLPWLDLVTSSLRHGQIPLWTPYELFGQPLLAQIQPGVTSPFVWLLALTPMRDGHLQIHFVHLWFVLIHILGALMAYSFLRDQGLREAAALLGGLLYATMGYYGNTDWPNLVATAIWAPAIFLFLFRAARGQAPVASSAMTGLFAGLAWISGYHPPAIYYTIGTSAVIAWVLATKRPGWRDGARLAAPFVVVLGLVSALITIPAVEYGKRALRYTASGAMRWNDRVGYPEHASNGFGANDLIHFVIQGADKQVEPFSGVIALSLAVMGILAGFQRAEVRILACMASASLLLSMPSSTFVYGVFYSILPLVEKARAPSMLMCVFHFAVAMLAGFGLDGLLSAELDGQKIRAVAKGAAAFGCLVWTVLLAAEFLRPVLSSLSIVTDKRPAMFALLAILFAAVCLTAVRQTIGPSALATLVCLLALLEQGNVSGYAWVHNSEKERRTFLKPIYESGALAQFLRARQPARAEVNTTDFGQFNLGDWYRLPVVQALVPTVLESTVRLGWWSDRTTQMFGVRYTVSRAATRNGQTEVFSDKSGMKVFENPGVQPRAWTVHTIVGADSDARAAETVFYPAVDIARAAVVVGQAPAVETCSGQDHVLEGTFELQRLSVGVEMACRGMLVISDTWFPGWTATVDGRAEPIREVDGGIRAVVLEKGPHRVEMRYQPNSVRMGFFLFLIGLGIVTVAQRFRSPGPNLLGELKST